MLADLVLMFLNHHVMLALKALAVFIRLIGISASSAIFWETDGHCIHLESTGLPFWPP